MMARANARWGGAKWLRASFLEAEKQRSPTSVPIVFIPGANWMQRRSAAKTAAVMPARPSAHPRQFLSLLLAALFYGILVISVLNSTGMLLSLIGTTLSLPPLYISLSISLSPPHISL
jgi:hypothetical protein